jgi:hypothetical protein
MQKVPPRPATKLALTGERDCYLEQDLNDNLQEVHENLLSKQQTLKPGSHEAGFLPFEAS